MTNPMAQNRNIDAIINVWKNRLLDLSKRNRALNFKVNKVSTVTVVDELPPEIFRLLCLDKKSLKFDSGEEIATRQENPNSESGSLFDEIDTDEDGTSPKKEKDQTFVPYKTKTLSSKHTDNILQTNSTSENLDKSLRRIDDQARSIIDEQGVNALFLTLGMLHYKESKDSDTSMRAPLILVPVELSRRTAREGFKISATDEEVIFNPSLAEYLKSNFAISLPEFPDSSSLSEDYDLQKYFRSLTKIFSNNKDWKITNEIYLGLFFFQKLVMYKDLEKNQAVVKAHKIFQRIINKQGDSHIGLPEEIRDLSLDEAFAPENAMQVVDADSSQLRAMAAVAQNHDLVMEGPPGTGKSQTITNMIAHALSQGKSVLFVAEKMAALDVVFSRLQKVGLGEFCLELHSTKANKKSVMQNLRHAVDASLTGVSQNETSTQRLSLVRNTLTEYINAVHMPFGALGVSPFHIYARLEKVLDASKMLLEVDISNISESTLEDELRNIDDLVAAGESIGSPQNHPWRDTTKTFYSEHALGEIESTGKTIISGINSLLVDAQKLEDILGLRKIKTFFDIETASDVATTLARSPGAPFEVLRSEAWNSAPPEAIELIKLGREIETLRRRVEQNFIATVFESDPLGEIEYVETKLNGIKKYFAFFDSKYRSIKKRWLSLRLNTYDESLIEQAFEMRFASAYLKKRNLLDSQKILGVQLFGTLWNSESSEWNQLDQYIKWVLEFRKIYIQKGLSERAIATATKATPDVSFVQTLRQDSIQIRDALQKLASLVGWNEEYFADWDVSVIQERVTQIVQNLPLAQRWAAFESTKQKIDGGFGKEILDWVRSGQIGLGDLSSTFQRAFFQKWLSLVIEERAALKEFHSVGHEQRVKEFQDLDKKILRQNQSNLIGNLRAKFQAALKTHEIQTQMLELRSQLNRQRGIWPLRLLMRKCFDVIRAVKPCFMMSPQTVAQLLDADHSQFDLILFDEASQVPTEDAVGAIIRGNQLVVVGDPKQLPPTNFFAVANGQVNFERDEDGEPIFQESESILEEVQNSGVPSTRLKWHYRSANESLITFSNVSFYDSDLFTFPSNETDAYRSGLQFEFVPDGLYEGKGLNAIEARSVADAVVSHFKANPNDSLGIGTFNLRQQIAIQDELELRRRNDLSLEPFFDRTLPEPFFVKNLENIQGDERDVIFLSVTYAKAHDGRLRYNFGPLNSENGWRRMNVLTSRARKSMRVFSSVRAEDIKLEGTASKGAKLLRDFLRYAEHRLLDSPAISTVLETDSPFEFEVYQELTRRGLHLEPQVGVSGYKIDFGVYDNAVTDKFVCGIECDGVAYHSSETARDRDRLRQQVLEDRGWEIHRIWSTDWFKDRNGQLERIVELVEQSRARAQSSPNVISSPNIDDRTRTGLRRDQLATAAAVPKTDHPEVGSFVLPVVANYKITSLTAPYHLHGFHGTHHEELEKMLKTLVECEAPLHIADICSRIAGAFGQRAGSRISSRISSVVASLCRKGIIEKRSDFVYASGAKINVRSRLGTGIPVDRVSPEELNEALLLVLRDGHCFDRNMLINHVRSVFGFERTGPKVKNAVENSIDQLLRDGKIGEGSLGIGLRR